MRRGTCSRIAALLCIAATSASGSQTPAPERRDWLGISRSVATWLRSTSIATEHGMTWPVDGLAPGIPGPGTIAEGSAGVLLFFAALSDVTGEPDAVRDVRRAADHLVATLPASLTGDAVPPATSLYTGLPSTGVALLQAYRVTGDGRYRDAVRRIVELVAGAARSDERGVFWSGTFNDLLFGNAGTALFLIEASRVVDGLSARDLAARAGHRLLALARDERGGSNWRFRTDREIVLPNFSHGTSGIAFVLATLFAHTSDARWLDAARSGARYLDAIARTDDGGTYLVPYGWPNPAWQGLFDLGWAHGPAGTARLFRRLADVTTDAEWQTRVMASAAGVRRLWEEGRRDLDLRFGAASAAMFLADVSEMTGGRRDAELAERLGSAIAAAATLDARGARWRLPRQPFMERAGEPAELTGWFHGAAGFGTALLRLAALEQRRPFPLRLPDDPFAAGKRDQ